MTSCVGEFGLPARVMTLTLTKRRVDKARAVSLCGLVALAPGLPSSIQPSMEICAGLRFCFACNDSRGRRANTSVWPLAFRFALK
jgi:hypothetical protein